jgi:tetratricopeptide (TPR) repeat protein
LGNSDTKDHALKAAINKAPALACTAANEIAEIAGERASQGKTSDAVDLYGLVVDISPNDLWARVHLGEQQEIAGETSAAIKTYEEVLSRDPESPEAEIASTKLAELLKKKEPAVSACSVLERLVNVYPNVRILRLYLGAALETKNDYEQARKIYEEGLKWYPEDILLHCRIAVLEIISDKTEKGLKIINSAIKKDPSIVSDVARSITETAQIMVASGNMTIAQTLYKLAYEISPNDLWALVHLGELYTISGENDTAIHTFREVLMKAPESPVTAAKLHALLKENYAFDCWSSLVAAHPTASVPRRYLGMVYEDRGDFKQASAQYKIILKNNPDFTEAMERLEIIKNAYSGPN